MPQDASQRLEALIKDMSVRLRPLCSDWPDDVFTAMVSRLAQITLKYEGEATTGIYDRRGSDSLRGEVRTMLDASDDPGEGKP